MPTAKSNTRHASSVRHVPTLTEIRKEVYITAMNKGFGESFRTIARIFFHTEYAECTLMMRRNVLRRIWDYVERRVAQRTEDIIDEALDLLEAGIDAEWVDDDHFAPKEAMAHAREDMAEECNRARRIGMASTFIELLCGGECDFSEEVLLNLANRLM